MSLHFGPAGGRRGRQAAVMQLLLGAAVQWAVQGSSPDCAILTAAKEGGELRLTFTRAAGAVYLFQSSSLVPNKYWRDDRQLPVSSEESAALLPITGQSRFYRVLEVMDRAFW